MTYIYLVLLIIFFGYGSFLRYLAPKRVGHIAGFRTQKAMLSQENWDQANYQFGGWLQQSGVVTLILLVLLYKTPLQNTSWGQWLLLIPVILIILAVSQVHQELPDSAGR